MRKETSPVLGAADLALLPALDVLLTEVNVTRAAQRLGISQPALSAKLGRLRDLIGDPLLVPSGNGRGMVLTPRATLLRVQVREALAGVGAALGTAPVFDPATSRATLRVVATDNAAALTLAVLLADLAANKAHGLRVALLRPDGRSIAERLESGDADLAIAADAPLPGGGQLRRRPVLQDRFATAQRKGHPRGTGPLDLEAFCAADHLLVSGEDGGFSGTVDHALTELGLSRRVVLSVHSYTLAPLITTLSDLLVTLPHGLLEHHGDRLDLFEPPIALDPFSLVVLWHDRTHDDPANRWVRERLFAADPVRGRGTAT